MNLKSNCLYCKAAQNQGKLPSSPDLFLRTHFKDVPGKGKVLANKTAQQIAVITCIYI